MRARALLSALALALACVLACGRSEIVEPRRRSASDAGRRPDAWVPEHRDASADPYDAAVDAGQPGRDAGRRPDAGSPGRDASTPCTQPAPWKLEPRSIKSARVVAEGFATPRLGSSVQLEVEVQLLGGCEELARVDVARMPGDATDFLTLSAFAWVQQGVACDPVAPVATTSALVPGRGSDNLRVVVSDGHAPANPALLSYGLSHCSTSDCWCDGAQPPGTALEYERCNTDCDCIMELACLPTLSPGGTYWGCRRPCSKHTDCPESGCSLDEYTPYVCGGNDACPYPEDCPAGFSCVLRDSTSFCEDQRQAPSSAACTCDAECPSGQRCVLGLWETPTCEIPCADDQDCPEPWLVCGTPATCVPLVD